MTKELRSHVHSAQRERGREETLIRQASAKQDYSNRSAKGGGWLAYDRRHTTAEGWRAPFLFCKPRLACSSNHAAAERSC
eukprot:3749025-Pyramimonas_sp.AAC.1